jgi:hypothetical protein
MLGKFAWLKVVAQNRKTIFILVKEAVFGRKKRPRPAPYEDSYEEPEAAKVAGD